jgi:two-component system response regulator YesN
MEKLTATLNAADKPKLLKAIAEIFAKLSASKELSLDYSHQICLHLVHASARLLMILDSYTVEMKTMEQSFWKQIFKLEILEDMQELVTTHLTSVLDMMNQKRNGKNKNTISQVMHVIDNGYHDKLTIQEIAKEVYLAPNYLCALFKQETGQTLNEYITKVRMEKAKELFKDKEKKINEICYAVGYNDPTYFTKIFKRYTGLNPIEYKEYIH